MLFYVFIFFLSALLLAIFRYKHLNSYVKRFGIINIYKFYIFYLFYFLIFFVFGIILILRKLPFFNSLSVLAAKKIFYTHNINGDKVLSSKEKIIYSLHFLIEFFTDTFKSYQYEYNLDLKNFIGFIGEKRLKFFFELHSPPRIACNIYLVNFLKKNFNPDQKVNIIDFGCGDGEYFNLFNKFFKNFNYIGIDKLELTDRWVNNNTILNWNKISKKHDNALFYNIDIVDFQNNKNNQISEIKTRFKKIDLIFSISVLEHIKKDFYALEMLNSHFKKSKNLHIVPAPLSYLGYLEHGYRRYSYEYLKKLPFDNVSVDGVGNFRILRYYFNFFKKRNKIPHYFFSFLGLNILKIKRREIFENFFSQQKNQSPIFYAFYF
jgi:hypothetical protein